MDKRGRDRDDEERAKATPRPATKAARAGERRLPPATRPAVMPIYQTSVFRFDGFGHLEDVFSGKVVAHKYTRMGNPNQEAFAEAVADLEHAESGISCGSGMAAMTVAVMTCAASGGRVVCARDVYGGTYSLLNNLLNKFGVATEFVDASDPEAVAGALKRDTRLVIVESISNPTMRLVDIPALAAVTRRSGAKLLVDSTFASPFVLNPIDLGADIVMHSATKYLTGQSAVTAGVLVSGSEFISSARSVLSSLGAILSPFEAWLGLLGLKSLALRMERHCSNALDLARMLEGHPAAARVHYPGLPSHPQNRLASAMMTRGFGGMLSFEVRGGAKAAKTVSSRLRLAEVEPSLAGPITTVSHPASTSHRDLSAEERARLGVTDSLIRVSVGLEDTRDILDDFEAALSLA